MAPVFDQLAQQYTSRGLKFLKVDVDQCSNTALNNNVRAMPTFLFFRNRTTVARMQGTDVAALEEKIRELAETSEVVAAAAAVAAEAGAPGFIDLSSFINKNQSECLNESDEHNLGHALLPGSGFYLESDCDEQLIINLDFNQPIKLHSLKFLAPVENGPKSVKIFINQPRTLDFDMASSMEPVQKLEVTKEDLANAQTLAVRFVKFQNVQNLTVS